MVSTLSDAGQTEQPKPLKSYVAFASTSDVLAGKNVKQAGIQRTKQAGQTLSRQANASKKRKTTRVQKKKRKKYNDIFT